MASHETEHERDLLTSNHGVFRDDDRTEIMGTAHAREASGEAWADIVRDFHTGKPRYWGYPVVPYGHPASKKKKTAEQIRTRNVLVFFWTALQSFVILKGFIMYFGLNYSIQHEDWYGGRDTDFYAWGLGISLAISFGGLLLFAIRKSREQHWD